MISSIYEKELPERLSSILFRILIPSLILIYIYGGTLYGGSGEIKEDTTVETLWFEQSHNMETKVVNSPRIRRVKFWLYIVK